MRSNPQNTVSIIQFVGICNSSCVKAAMKTLKRKKRKENIGFFIQGKFFFYFIFSIFSKLENEIVEFSSSLALSGVFFISLFYFFDLRWFEKKLIKIKSLRRNPKRNLRKRRKFYSQQNFLSTPKPRIY